MCNPRRVRIELSQAIEQAWQTTVSETATLEDEVNQLARLTLDIPLSQEMGAAALAMLERVLQGEFPEYEAWEQDDQGHYRHELGQVTLIYQPGTSQLIVEAALTERISAEAQATAEAGGFTVGEVAAEAIGRYYDDGWSDRTEELARAQAQQEAEDRLAQATEALHRQQHAEEISAATAQAQAEAQAQAQADLEQLQAETLAALQHRLQTILADTQEQVQRTMNRLVGETYRQTLLLAARENGGRIIRDERAGTVLTLELEL